MNSQVIKWAVRNGVSAVALGELRELFLMEAVTISNPPEDASEAYVQSLVRIEAAHKGLKLWRNNVGALRDERGVPVRYGLGNDSPSLNKVIKSGDLIGWRSIVINSSHIGSRIAQFVSRECKRPDWKFTGTEHETAQLRWAETIVADGGDATFCKGAGTL